jgi:hypothetical protein
MAHVSEIKLPCRVCRGSNDQNDVTKKTLKNSPSAAAIAHLDALDMQMGSR